ncbi:LysR substrate-binding domain-containing protein [Pseudomonas sp. LRF_L74]|uniref:LysR substrate-binding domain-containing protein n=1 Tax=Pseudomonas sp. LRF_L74 TaxID=3369422 RepID=UPI003F60B631
MKTTLDELLALTRVVDSGSITAAAEQLGQTTSGVSRALARLEEKLGVTLLRRTTRRLELTEEGSVFLVQARRIIAAVEAAEEQMTLRRQVPSGLLRVNAASPFMLHVLVPLVEGFRARYPQVELELNSDDLIIDLLEQRTDLAIRIGALRDSSLHARLLATTRIRILASPAYLAEHGTPQTVADLQRHSLIGFTQPRSLNLWPLRSPHDEDIEIIPSLRASSGETIRHLALAGAGLVRLSDFMTEQDRASGALVEVLADLNLPRLQPINAVYHRNTALSARIACFLDYLSERLEGQAWVA